MQTTKSDRRRYGDDYRILQENHIPQGSRVVQLYRKSQSRHTLDLPDDLYLHLRELLVSSQLFYSSHRLLFYSDGCTDVVQNRQSDGSSEPASTSVTKTSSIDAPPMPTEHDEDVKTSKHVEPSEGFSGDAFVLILGTPSNCI